MKNKVELKKAIIFSLVIFFILSVVFCILNYLEYTKYTKVLNFKIDMIILNIKEKYPDLEVNKIVDILNSNEAKTKDILREYGIDITKDSAILENDRHFKFYLGLEVATIFALFIGVSMVFLAYNHSKGKKLKEITKYIEEINRKNYKLDIEDNTEDELSILKNEIYKVTVMLKESSENSIEDKIKLKNSLSDISHQIKTPLTSITIMLDNMLDNENMEVDIRKEFIKDIKRAITNLNFLIGALLKLSKFDANTIKFINKEESVEEIIREAAKNVEGLCDLKNIRINFNIDSNIEKINCDFKWQVEALTNILKNCAEHSNNDSFIDIKCSSNKIYTKIEIRDYGTGIKKEDLPHIFDRFYKGENSSNDSVGIGLALAKLIIKENEGYIDVESEDGKGTTFIIKYF